MQLFSDKPVLTDEYLRQAVSAMTNIPIDRLSLNQTKDLIWLGEATSVGQTKRLYNWRARFANKAGLNRQRAAQSFWVRLELVRSGIMRVLAREAFGGDDSLIKNWTCEFSERHTANVRRCAGWQSAMRTAEING